MSNSHQAYLCLGSNIQPETHLRRALSSLKERGQVPAVSSAWETHAVGAPGSPNFLNACALLLTPYSPDEILENVIRPIETSLGRIRSEDKNTPRPIDIDLVLFDDQPLRLEYWQEAFMLVPLAELIPQFIQPLTGQSLAVEAEKARRRIWIAARPEVLQGFPRWKPRSAAAPRRVRCYSKIPGGSKDWCGRTHALPRWSCARRAS